MDLGASWAGSGALRETVIATLAAKAEIADLSMLCLPITVISLCTNLLVGPPTSQAGAGAKTRGARRGGVPKKSCGSKGGARSAPGPPVLLHLDRPAPGVALPFASSHGRRCR